MHERLSQPATERPSAQPQTAKPQTPAAKVIELQRQAGNRAVVTALNLSRCGASPCSCGHCGEEEELLGAGMHP